MFRIIDSKRKKGICVAHGCTNKSHNTDRFCPKHRRRYQKETNPARYYFDLLRGNAKRRGKTFELTFEEFKLFCSKTRYLELKGKKGSSMSIDRIDPSKGYSYKNIQMLSLAENARKQHSDCPF